VNHTLMLITMKPTRILTTRLLALAVRVWKK
jgi:hypothetical protein